MKDFYQIIDELPPYYDNMVVTVIDGENFGEKAIFSKGNLVYESIEESFMKRYQDKILSDIHNGLLLVEGQRLFCESLGSEKKLVICGGGHVSIPIIKIGKMLDFHVTVVEDRPLYADNSRKAEADEVICDDFKKALEHIEGDLDTYFIIVTRGHRYDQVCLEEIIQKENAYIGMIGSKVRVKKVKEVLLEKGYSSERLGEIYSPIGLNIGAQTPEEIAVAIMAEIIQVKNQEKRSCGYPKDIKKAIFNEEKRTMPKILATIVSRKGSAPREVGTKMLIYKDGTTTGTIGGGCVEAEICTKARMQLMEEDSSPELCMVDMTGQDAEEEGMVCGGIIEILLERVS